MPKTQLPITKGYYKTGSKPVSNQRCVNLYPVIERRRSLVRETLRAPPGVTLILADPEVPLFDPLDPDSEGSHDPSGPTPPDPDSRPAIPDAPTPDLDEDSGADPDGDRPSYPITEYPECVPYDCAALDATYPANGRFLFTSATPDVSAWLPWDSGAITFTNRATDTENTAPDGTNPISSLVQVSGVSRPITELSDDSAFTAEIPDFCFEESYIFDHNGGTDAIAWAFGQAATKVNMSAILGPGRSSRFIFGSMTARGTHLINFRGRMPYSYVFVSSGTVVNQNPECEVYVSATSIDTDGELEIRIWTETESFVLNEVVGIIPIDDGFYNNEFSFWRVTLSVGEGVSFDELVNGRTRRGVSINAEVEVRHFSDASGEYVTNIVSGSCPASPNIQAYPEGTAPPGGFEWSENPVFVPDRIGILGGGTYSIAMASTQEDAEFPDMASLQLAWERNKATYTPPSYC